MAKAPNRLIRVPLVLGVIAASAWLWWCWCFFPSLPFSEVRLEPSFMLAHGISIYPALGKGPVTTWIYGPISPFLYLPATLAASAASAMMIAGGINLLIVIGSMCLVCALWPTPVGSTANGLDRCVVGLLCIAIWPASSLQFIQADNAAVAFGLVGSLIMVRSRSDAGPTRWFAAAAGIAAIGCKQTALGAVVAQVLWLGWREGWPNATRHTIRAGICGLALILATIAFFGPEGSWLNLVHIPARLPWTSQWLLRAWDLTPLLAVHIFLPGFVFIVARRRIWTSDSPLLLPALCWVTALPAGAASLYKIGGTINSIESLLLFMPAALLFFIASQRNTNWVRAGFAVAALGVLLFRIVQAPASTWTPRVAHLRQAKILAAQFPNQMWLPWNPLITFYSDRRFYHVEDGLFVRFVAGQPLTLAEAHDHLPRDWRAMALLRGSSDWGLASHLCPADAQVTETGLWTLYTWSR